MKKFYTYLQLGLWLLIVLAMPQIGSTQSCTVTPIDIREKTDWTTNCARTIEECDFTNGPLCNNTASSNWLLLDQNNYCIPKPACNAVGFDKILVTQGLEGTWNVKNIGSGTQNTRVRLEGCIKAWVNNIAFTPLTPNVFTGLITLAPGKDSSGTFVPQTSTVEFGGSYTDLFAATCSGNVCFEGLADGFTSLSISSGNLQAITSVTGSLKACVTYRTFAWNVTGTEAACEMSADGKVFVNFTPAPGTMASDYEIRVGNGGAWTVSQAAVSGANTIGGLPAGSYTVAVVYKPLANAVIPSNDATCGYCKASVTIGSATATLSCSSDPDCPGGSADGSVTVTVGGNPGTVTYNWGDGNTNATLSNLLPGDYTVTVTYGPNGKCSKTTICTVLAAPGVDFDVTPTNIVCFGANNGTITVDPTTGTPNFTVGVTGQTNKTSNGGAVSFNNLAPGPYTITVTDANGCITTKMVTLTEPNPVTITCASVNTSCKGLSDGKIRVTGVTSDVGGPYKVSVDQIAGGNNDIAESVQTIPYEATVGTGTYVITVKDKNDCIARCTTIVKDGFTPAINCVRTQIACFGGKGTITATASGTDADGNPVGSTFDYVLSGSASASNTTGIFTGLSAGTYTVTATKTGNVGCSVACTGNIIVEPAQLSCTITGNNSVCRNEKITFTGPAGMTNYVWTVTGATFTGQGTVSIEVTAPASGSFEVKLKTQKTSTVDNVTLCESGECTKMVSVTVPTCPIIAPKTVCAGTQNVEYDAGSGYTNIVWSTSNSQISIASGQGTHKVRFNVAATAVGPYTITFTARQNGCPISCEYILTVDPLPSIVLTPEQPVCRNPPTGKITAVASGGTGPYVFVIRQGAANGPVITPTITNLTTTSLIYNGLAEGTYYITVTDNKGCSSDPSVQILAVVNPLDFTLTLDCDNQVAGNVAVNLTNITGGAAAPNGYEYQVDGTAGTWIGLVNPIFLPVNSGNYTIYLREKGVATGCDPYGKVINTTCCKLDGLCKLTTPAPIIGCDLSGVPGPKTNPTDVFSGVTFCTEARIQVTTTNGGSLCGGGLTRTYTYLLYDDVIDNNIFDAGEPFIAGTCAETYTVTPPPVVINCPANNLTIPACTSADDAQTFLTNYKAQFSFSGGCNAVPSFSAVVLPNPCTGGTVSLIYTVTSDCDTKSCTKSIIRTVNPSITLNCADNVNITTCKTQDQVDTEFENWLSQFSVTGGCNATGRFDGEPEAPLACGGTTTVTYRVVDPFGCNTQTCTKTFTVTPPALVINCPANNLTIPACTSANDAQTLLTNYKALFSFSGGCNAVPSFSAVVLPNPCTGGTVSLTYTVTSDCDTKTCTKSIIRTVNPSITLNCADNVNITTCKTQTEINDQFEDWLGDFSVTGGCDATGRFDGEPTAPPACGGTTTVTYRVVDAFGCNTQTCTKIFTVTPPALVISCPEEKLFITACTSVTEAQALLDAYKTQFSYTGGCNAVATFSTVVFPELCVGGVLNIKYKVISDCDRDSCIREIEIEALRPVSVGDTAFVDNDLDGLQEAGDQGLAGVTVTLYNATTNTTLTTNAYGFPLYPLVTDANGAYLFDSLAPGSYYVVFNKNTAVNGANYVPTIQNVNANGNDADDSDASPTNGQTAATPFLNAGEKDLTLDAGFYLPVTVGDTAFVDNDFDGLQEAGDQGLAGVTVTLYNAATNAVVTTNAYGLPVVPQVTNANGAYLFDSLAVGSYYVVFNKNTAVNGANYVPTKEDVNANANDADDSDANSVGQTEATGFLTSGQKNLTLDAGFYLPVTVGDTAFVDNDFDGLQEAGDQGLAGVTVTLYNAATNAIVTTNAYGLPVVPQVTNANGAYLFDSLAVGSYYVVFNKNTAVNGANYVPTKEDVNANANDADDSDANLIGQTEATGFLTSGQKNLTLDAGFYLPVTVGDTAFVDNDLDGLQEAGDQGLAGVTVTLYNATTNAIVTTNAYGLPVVPQVTNASGAYLFDSLAVGSYYVVFNKNTAVNGANYVPTKEDVNANANDADDSDANSAGQTEATGFLTSGQKNLTLDAGFYLPVTVGDTAFIDNNGDGLQDAGDEAFPGVTVTLYDATNNTIVTTNAYGLPVVPQVTDANGKYLFDSLAVGNYYVVFNKNTAVNGANYVPTKEDVNGNGNDADDSDANPAGQTEPTGFLTSGQKNLTLDAGFFLPVAVGDTAFVDNDRDGLQEAGDEGLAGVTVTIFNANGTPVTLDAAGKPYNNITVTGADGSYLFTKLPPGSYYVVFDKSTAVNGPNYAPTTQNVNSNGNDTDDSDAHPTTGRTAATPFLTSGQSDLTLDAGFYLPVTVGDTAFIDNDFDGLQEAGDQGLAGVTVTLYDALTNTVVTTNAFGLPVVPQITDANGKYLFDSLAVGNYYVVFNKNTAVNGANYVPTKEDVNADANDADDSDANAAGQSDPTGLLTSGQKNLTLDAGFYLPVSVGDTTFVDNNGNGLQDPGDPGLPGVTVTLYNAATNTVVTTNAYGLPVVPQITDTNGKYLFDSLAVGSYYVVFNVTTAVNGHLYSTTEPNVGNNDSKDSDADPFTGHTLATPLLTSGQSNTTLDAGYILCAPISCINVQVKLGNNCEVLITPEMVLVGTTNYPSAAGFTFLVADMNGRPIPGNLVTGQYAGMRLRYSIQRNGCTDILCWGEILVEDGSRPRIARTSFTPNPVYCFDANFIVNNPKTIGELGVKPSPRQIPAGTIVSGGNINDEVLNLGIAEFFYCDPTCKVSVKWSDRLEVYECDSINATGTWGRIYRSWVATNCNGMIKDTVQVIVLKRPALSAFAFTGKGEKDPAAPAYDWTVTYNACSPDKSLIKKEDWMPRINSTFHMLPDLDRRFFLDQVECNYSVQIKDTEFPICNGKGLKIDREIYVFDWCKGGIVDTFHVLIKIGDFEAPTYEYAHGAPFDISTGPMDCTAAIPVTVAGIKSAFGVTIKDNCTLGNVSVSVYTKDRYVKGILVYQGPDNPFCRTRDANGAKLRGDHEEYQLGACNKEDICWEKVDYAVMNGMMIGLPIGKHLMVIDAFDGCYNASTACFIFEVKDKIAPVMKCDDDLHVTLSNANGYTNGYAQVSAADIDEGSWDNCKLAWIAVRRNVPDGCAASFIQKGYDTNGNGKLDALPADGDVTKADGFDLNGDGDIADFGETFILKGGKLMTPLLDYVEFFCCDLSERVTVELWGGDIYGNTNYCWMDLLIEDKVAPTCNAPWDVTIYCDDKNLGSIDDKVASAKIFGDLTITSGNDCAALDTVYTVEKKLKCGAGYIIRKWTLTKQTVKGPISITCSQKIIVLGIHEYNICFPKDATSDCKTPIVDSVLTDELGCDILAVNVFDKRYDASDDECYKIFRTYTVINWCAYTDECGDPMAEGNVYVVERSTFGNYGKAPIYVLVRDKDRDGNEEFYLSKDLTPNNADDERFYPPTCGTTPKLVENKVVPIEGEYYQSFMYTQIIKVYDSELPVVTGVRDTFCTSPIACTANITKVVTIKDNCTDKVELERQQLMIAPFQSLDAGKMITYSTPRWSTKDLGNGQYEITVSNLPEGTHDLIVVGRDECGNLSLPTRIPFVVKDCKAPAPICINGLSTELMPDGNNGGMMAIWASDFVASKIYDCNGQGPETQEGLKLVTKYSINRVGEPVVSTQTGLNLTCADAGKVVLVELHAWDNAGNHDFCVTFVEVQDNRKVCPDPSNVVTGEISGLVATDDAEPVLGVKIDVSGGAQMNQNTLTNGLFNFGKLPLDSDFTVAAQLDKDHLNGVSTFDLVQLQKHILGVQTINNPYRLIAADVNNSKSISTLDMIQMRKLILNIDERFSNVPSWRFVDAAYQFPDPNNPWIEAFPEVVNVNDLAGKVQANFIAIKMGDVNGNAQVSSTASAEVRSTKALQLTTEEQELKAGQRYTVAIRAKDLAAIQGFQFTLQVDPAMAQLENIEYNGVMKADHFGYFPRSGQITSSYVGAPLAGAPLSSTTAESVLFTLHLKAESNLLLSKVLNLNSQLTPKEAYDKEDELMDVQLEVKGATLSDLAALHQNTPNPFVEETSIGFYLPTASAATLTVRDVKGALLYRLEGNYAKGENQVTLKHEQLRSSGVLYYTLETADFTATKKMILLNK